MYELASACLSWPIGAAEHLGLISGVQLRLAWMRAADSYTGSQRRVLGKRLGFRFAIFCLNLKAGNECSDQASGRKQARARSGTPRASVSAQSLPVFFAARPGGRRGAGQHPRIDGVLLLFAAAREVLVAGYQRYRPQQRSDKPS